jgi:hypothetical protein
LLLLVQISLLLLATHDRAKDIQSKRDTHQKCFDCTRVVTYHSVSFPHFFLSRTDRAVLAVNGFAADGNMFVKKVKQRLEVRHSLM